MEPLSTGTLAGTGSFRCESCGYVLTQSSEAELPPCPSCRSEAFVRSSLLGAAQLAGDADEPAAGDREAFSAAARELLEGPGEHLAFRDGETVRVLPLASGGTRIGRSLTADVRFDDATVSRRHALVVREADAVRVLDDRSLNGTLVNGRRIDQHTLRDGDEIVVGRHRLLFLVGAAAPASPA